MLIPTVISLAMAFTLQGETNEGSNLWSQIESIQNKNVAQSQNQQTISIPKMEKTVAKKENKLKTKKISNNSSWQTYEITAYTWTGNKTSSGVYPKEGRTVASNYLPKGTIIEIEGLGRRIVEDTGSHKYLKKNVIDLYIGHNVEQAKYFGRQNRKVKIIKMGD